jgi:predicted DNA-binding WGR domain protein
VIFFQEKYFYQQKYQHISRLVKKGVVGNRRHVRRGSLVASFSDTGRAKVGGVSPLIAMIQRRAKAAGIITRIGNHTFRATGVTAYLKNGGTLERAAQMANQPPHAQHSFTTAAPKKGHSTKLSGYSFEPIDDCEACTMNAVHLRRIDPARNMPGFYRLDVQPDLYGGVLLVKEWGRIGARGRTVAERYDSEALATDALQRHERKRRRGYAE